MNHVCPACAADVFERAQGVETGAQRNWAVVFRGVQPQQDGPGRMRMPWSGQIGS